MVQYIILPKSRIISLDDCRLCEEGRKNIGDIGKKAAIVYKTGPDPTIDWLVTLQRSNISDPERGFTLLLMPVGHLTAFSQVHSSRKLAQNYGMAFATAHYGMQVIREEPHLKEAEKLSDLLYDEWTSEFGGFTLAAVDYGKCASAINTQEHIHVKAYTLDGSVAQPSPSDTEWIKGDTFTDANGSKYVKALPVVKGELEETRYQGLARRLVEVCNNP